MRGSTCSKHTWLKDKPDHVYFSQPIQAAMGKLVALAKQAGRTPAQMALAFVMKHPVTAIPIIAPTTREQLHDSLGACDIVVDEAMSKAFDAIVAPGDSILGNGFNPYKGGEVRAITADAGISRFEAEEGPELVENGIGCGG